LGRFVGVVGDVTCVMRERERERESIGWVGSWGSWVTCVLRERARERKRKSWVGGLVGVVVDK